MKVHLRMLGCRLNQAEIDAMTRQFQSLGHEIVGDPALADEMVVNTCAVTQDASHSSRQLVRQLHRANERASISVTGCYAQIEPEKIATLPGVGQVIANSEKDSLVARVTGNTPAQFDSEPLERAPDAIRAGRTRAFVKVQDGCDNACTFCVTTIARGEGRSRGASEIIAEVQRLQVSGYREIVLTGVHLGSYGCDLGDERGLAHLVRVLLAETNVPRLRLSSLEPWDLNPAFFDLWEDPRLCRHVHLPLQSGCDATLRRMARRTTQAQFRALVGAIRDRVPQMAITSDVIVGFPGETDAEFAESLSFVEAMAFASLHVFRYSKRPGTPASRMRGSVPEAVKRERSRRMMTHGESQERLFAERCAGVTLPVLWEQVAGVSEQGFINVGYTDNYIRVRCVHPRVLTNMLLPARLEVYDPVGRQMSCKPIID